MAVEQGLVQERLLKRGLEKREGQDVGRDRSANSRTLPVNPFMGRFLEFRMEDVQSQHILPGGAQGVGCQE